MKKDLLMFAQSSLGLGVGVVCLGCILSSADINQATERDFLNAVSSGNLRLAKEILDAHPAYIDARTKYGLSALHYAATPQRSEGTAMIEFLVSHTRDVNVCDRGGYTPLHLAAMLNRPNVVSFLIEKGAKVDYGGPKLNTPDHAESPLCAAAISGAIESAKLLIKAGARVGVEPGPEFRIGVGGTKERIRRDGALHYACITPLSENDLREEGNPGNGKMLELLIKSGADINELNGYGLAPLHHAVDLLRKDVVNELLRLKAGVNAKTAGGTTSLHILAEMDFNRLGDKSDEARTKAKQIAKLLTRSGGKLDLLDNRGKTVLETAAEHGNLKLFEESQGSNGCEG
jgi:ankyrin repeat protein